MAERARSVLGIDLGTSSLKCVILDAAGDIRAAATESYPTSGAHAGWAEQDPADWLAALRAAIAALRAQDAAGIDGLRCIGFCSAAHIPVLLDEAERVIRPAILWSDQRSGEEAAFLQRHHAQTIEPVTLNQANCTWTLPQLSWLCAHEPAAIARTHSLLSSKDYLIFHLTGRRVMDLGSAAATLMFDSRQRKWNAELVTLGGLPASAMPPVFGACEVIGRTAAPAAAALGLPAGVPVVAGTLDSAAEMVGCGLLGAEDGGMIRIGAAGGVMAMDPRPICLRGIITYPFVDGDCFYRQAGTNTAATALQWAKGLFEFLGDDVRGRITFEFLDQLVTTTPPGADGLVFHPYLQGERAPYWNPNLSACFSGICQRHGWPHFVRAVMEGVAFSLRDCLEMFGREGLAVERAVMAGGVVKSPVWSQIVADVLGIELQTIRHGDSAFGSALMAAVGGGIFADLHAAAAVCVHHDRCIMPDAANAERCTRMFWRYAETARMLDRRAAGDAQR